jgi:hypothetical protein
MELNQQEKRKYLVIKEYVDGKLSRKQAAVKLNVCAKTISILRSSYLTNGKSAFSHGLKTTVPVNRTRRVVERRIVDCYKGGYIGFNFTHFYEQIETSGLLYKMTDGEYISRRSVARILGRNNLVSPRAKRKRRKDNSHPVRLRRTSFGELVQLDASLHDWLSLGMQHKITLHLAIDDATSNVLAGYFCETETLHGYFQIAYQIFVGYGVPVDFYTDKRTVFEYRSGKRKEAEHIQFKNACNQLGIGIITTSVAQAKGRVERSFRTHQDRLVSELRLAGITTVWQANEYLVGYIRQHNIKYALAHTNSETDVFRPLDESIEPNKLLSVISQRKILNGNIISFKSCQYLPIKSDGSQLILPVNTPVETIETLDGQLLIRHDSIYYQVQHFANGRLTAHSPPVAHPWKQTYGLKLSRSKHS